ncbi:MAG: riboflavin synthase [Planctomycetes bacterium]|nr:riboflavin synthase [Planctomycetota bacterium]
MFTGIVQATGKIASLDKTPAGVRLVVDRSAWRPRSEPAIGDSICVSGVCLTLVKHGPGTLQFDVIAETLAKTSLGRRSAGDAVNLEPSLTADTPIGGHFMQGHVDATGVVTCIQTGSDYRITIRPPADLMDYIVPKGSIAIDGVSLTLAAVHDDTFEVALIPTTLDMTTLGALKTGDEVNLETDIISKTVVNYLRRRQTRP